MYSILLGNIYLKEVKKKGMKIKIFLVRDKDIDSG